MVKHLRYSFDFLHSSLVCNMKTINNGNTLPLVTHIAYNKHRLLILPRSFFVIALLRRSIFVKLENKGQMKNLAKIAKAVKVNRCLFLALGRRLFLAKSNFWCPECQACRKVGFWEPI